MNKQKRRKKKKTEKDKDTELHKFSFEAVAMICWWTFFDYSSKILYDVVNCQLGG